jgi:hypothetical protein
MGIDGKKLKRVNKWSGSGGIKAGKIREWNRE